MKIRTFLRATLLGFALVTAGSTATYAQSDSLVQLQLELDALDTVTDTLGPMRAGASKRMELMQTFIAQSGRMDAWKSWSGDAKDDAFHGLSFQQAYERALDAEKARGLPKPTTQNRDTLASEVKGQRTLAEDSWNAVNALHEQVARMTAFLNSQGAMDDYVAFAQQQAKNPPPAPDAGTDRRSEQGGITPEQRQENIAKYRAQQEALKKHWDHYHFTSGYGPVPPGGPFRGNPEGSPVGRNPNQSGDYDPYIGSYPNAAVDSEYYGGDYWGGSWWNGYADPYYDVYGYGDRWAGDRARRAYHRAHNAHPDFHHRR
ncbi:MAG: hypothetical protein VX726_11230 [Planctomycetota bacterium]|nr:hypothetical protein [Planctomycetota bacterium]